MSSEQPRFSRKRRARLIATSLVTVAILGAGGYVAACAVAPVPEPELMIATTGVETVEATGDAAQAAVDVQPFPTAIGWLHDDEVWSNDEGVYPLGSITKLITILVCMEQKPLEPGSEGDTYVWTADDAALTEMYMAVDGVAYNLPVGTELTQRDMLKFIFLPSANDFAHSYALWTFGSNEAFIAAFEDWKARHGLESINLIEPTGMEIEDTANAADLVRVARLAINNPTISEFNGMKFAEMPWGIGTIENSNPLLGVMPGVIGTKTGTIYSNYNLIVSQRTDVDGREATSIAVTLARPSKDARAASGETMLNAMSVLPQPVTVIDEGAHLGTLTSVDGQTADLVAGGSATATLLPGEEASWQLSDDHTSVTVQTPSGESTIAVSHPPAFETPDLWWRLTNPGVLFW